MEWESGGKRRIRLRNLRSWAWLLGKSLKSEPAFEPQNGRGKHRFCASVVENRVVSCRPERIQMGEDPHGYTINDPSPLYSFDFSHQYSKIIHPEAIFGRPQNFKDIIRMGTGFSHRLTHLSTGGLDPIGQSSQTWPSSWETFEARALKKPAA